MAREVSLFRDLLYKRVVDSAGKRLGVVVDLAADFEGEVLLVRHLLISTRIGLGRSTPPFLIAWEEVERLEPEVIRLKIASDKAEGIQPKSGRILLKRDLMDGQIVDVNGVKLLRVDDLRLLHEEGTMTVAGLEVGPSGLLLRVDPKQHLPRLLRRLGFTLRENVIPWELVKRVDPKRRRVQLKLPRERLKSW